jgi:hypothetical protein
LDNEPNSSSRKNAGSEAIAMNIIRRLAIVPYVVFVCATFASAIYAQTPRGLQIEVGPNQQVAIVASDVSYGEVLRVLAHKLGWEIEIPALADELKISTIRVEATKPPDALRKLLEGSRLGYAFQDAGNGSLKVAVIPMDKDASAPEYDKDKPVPSSHTAQTQSSTPGQPTETVVVATPNRPDATVTMSLSEATKAVGAPPGVPSADMGRKVTFAISDAAKVMGVPPGVSPDDVGRTTTLPMSEAAKIIGVPPGVLSGDVGKVITLPLPTGASKRP